jgi:4-hydroxy-3-methylbut-2-enyl diphosphate reductase IspH
MSITHFVEHATKNDDDRSFASNLFANASSFKIMRHNIKCHVFESEKQNEFHSWWRDTIWYSSNEEKFAKYKKNIHWSFEKKTVHWKKYCETTSVSEEVSKIICKRCNIVLTYSSIESRNTIMLNHLSSNDCKKTSVFRDLKQLLLQMSYRAIISDRTIIKTIIITCSVLIF